MTLSRKIFIILLSTFLLTSCFESKTPEVTNKNTLSPNINNLSSQAIEQAAIEQQRINKLSELTSDNLATQVETKDGKKILRDRRLFINSFKSENVNSSAKLIAALEKVEKFTKSNKVELNDSDIRVMIAGSQIDNPSWNVCGDFNATKKDLDSNNKYYGYINKLCNPPAPPSPGKGK